MSEAPNWRIPPWNLGDRLRKSLEHAGIKHGEMADYLGLDRNTIGNYISGRTRISPPALKLWAMRTGVPVQWLETGIAPRPEPEGDGECAARDSNPEPSDYAVLSMIRPSAA